jgi:hypothetical protein
MSTAVTHKRKATVPLTRLTKKEFYSRLDRLPLDKLMTLAVEKGCFTDKRPPGFFFIRADGTSARLCSTVDVGDAQREAFGAGHGHLIWEEDTQRRRKFCAWLDEDSCYGKCTDSTVCADVLDALDISFAGTITRALLSRADGTAFAAHDLDKIERLWAYWKRVHELNAVYAAYEEGPEDAPFMAEPDYGDEPEVSSFESCEEEEDDV